MTIYEEEKHTDDAAMMSEIEQMFQLLLATNKQERAAPKSPKYIQTQWMLQMGESGPVPTDAFQLTVERNAGTATYYRAARKLQGADAG